MSCMLNQLLMPIPSNLPNLDHLSPKHLVLSKSTQFTSNIDTKCQSAIDSAILRFKRRAFTQGYYHTLSSLQKQQDQQDETTKDPLLDQIRLTVTHSTKDICRNGNIDAELLSTLNIQDETYTIAIHSSFVEISATSIVGVLRGLVTVTQLIVWNPNKKQHLLSTCGDDTLIIEDQPRFAWRGLMLDTSRHYYSKQSIVNIINGMEMIKINIFHWHIVDAQSFPYVSKTYPLLAKKGSYQYPEATYDPATIQEIIQHAANNGIRVIPEFDLPSHAASWGRGYPELELTVMCPELIKDDSGSNVPMQEHGIDRVSLNPLNNQTYLFISNLLNDVLESFPDTYIHIGGDEVNTQCWKQKNRKIKNWIDQKGNGHGSNLQAYFERRLLNILATKLKKRIPVVWDEVLDLGDSHLHGNKDGSDEINNLPSGSIIQWWRSWSNNVIERATARSFKVVQSHSYYLDHLDTDWVKMYHAALNDQLLGGEACSWSEHVSSINVEHQIFSKLPAVAERLWSTAIDTTIAGSKIEIGLTARRMGRLLCFLKQRDGIMVGPEYPDYCSDVSVVGTEDTDTDEENKEVKSAKMLLRSQQQLQVQPRRQLLSVLSLDSPESSYSPVPKVVIVIVMLFIYVAFAKKICIK